jgi:hypothetical protein
MASQAPFIDPDTQELDTDQIRSEAIPLAKLIGLFVLISLLPFALGLLLLGNEGLGAVFVVIGQFILAIGGGIVLMYVIARGMRLSGG